MQVRKMRVLRLKYGISIVELARTCGVSKQRISEIELKTDIPIKIETAEMVKDAFTRLIEKKRKKVQRLYQDFESHKDTLMDYVEEIGYEL